MGRAETTHVQQNTQDAPCSKYHVKKIKSALKVVVALVYIQYITEENVVLWMSYFALQLLHFRATALASLR